MEHSKLDINLIPEKLRPKKVNPWPYIVVGTLCVLFLSLTIYGMVWAGSVKERCAKLSGEVNKLDKQVKDKGKVADQVAKLQGEIVKLEKESDSLSDILAGRIVWSRLMLEMAKAIPPSLAVKEFAGADGGGAYKLSGTSSSKEAGPDVARFAARLRSSAYVGKVFKVVKIDSCSLAVEGGPASTAFSLHMALRDNFCPVTAVASAKGTDRGKEK
jgi:Tfp pilus assembly protein PilN